MKKNKSKLTVLKEIKKFKNKKGTRIYVGYLEMSNELVKAIQVETKEGYGILVSHKGKGFALPLWAFFSVYNLLGKDKIARRWFLKEAYRLPYGSKILKDYISNVGILDWELADKEDGRD